MKNLVLLLALLAIGACTRSPKQARATIPSTGLPPMMHKQVLNAVDAGEGNPRVRELRDAVAAKPNNVRARVDLATEYGRTGYPELELEHLRLAAERFPDSEVAVRYAARALVRADRAAEAARRLTAFISAHEKVSAALLSWAGIALDQQFRWTEGEKMHRRAVDRAGWRDELHNNLGYNLLMQGRKQEAAESFRKAISLNAASETARNNLGIAVADHPEEALAQFRQASSDLGVAHNNLASYLYDKGDLGGARKELELALEYRKDMPQILDNLRKVASADGKPVTIARKDHHSFWKSVGRGVKLFFVPEDAKKSTGLAEAAR
ncbi:MAG: tetratricopeptide repeat protein [Acidobacteria bacterium]|nr:tetratricopeptide repeat protein [Acidobacteriota bacterium]